jgi:hypothetical protein
VLSRSPLAVDESDSEDPQTDPTNPVPPSGDLHAIPAVFEPELAALTDDDEEPDVLSRVPLPKPGSTELEEE